MIISRPCKFPLLEVTCQILFVDNLITRTPVITITSVSFIGIIGLYTVAQLGSGFGVISVFSVCDMTKDSIIR